MKTFTVKQVAEILKTNEETVRRWIRSGKLGATLNSKKSGHVISADSLNRFLSSTPKYAATVKESFAVSPLALSIVMGSVLGGLVALTGNTKRVTSKDVERCIKEKIRDYEKSVAKKEAQLAKLQEEIAQERQMMDKYQYALANLDLEAIADGVNAEKKK